ncbi:hypothetical protein BASA81_000338 [Batrachochytrium salamandrivorans]|nr:hypothetical protein BASA81_000338 [Batrachochytrium salamandrivorans]
MLAFKDVDTVEELGNHLAALSLTDSASLSLPGSHTQVAKTYDHHKFTPKQKGAPLDKLGPIVTKCKGLYEANKELSEAAVTPVLEEIINDVLKVADFDLVLVDKSKSGKANRTNDGLVPDTFVLPAGHALDAKSPRELWWKRSSFLVEYKKYDVDLSTYECLGQAVQYGKELLRLCPARQQAVTVLFNLRTVRIVVVSRKSSSSGLRVESSDTEAMDTSGPPFIWSAAVMAHSSSTFPWSLAKALSAPDKERRTDKTRGDYCFMASLSMDVLGSGATSRVLHADAKYCTKIFKPTRDARFDEFRNEKGILEKLQGLRASLGEEDGPRKALPELLYATEEAVVEAMQTNEQANHPLVIVTSPVGIPLDKCNVGDVAFSSFVTATRALEVVHANGIVHRDLGPNNWVTLRKGELAIIDWGFALEQGKEEDGIPENKQQEEYAGSIWFAADSVLTGLLANWELKEDTGDLVSASTDLESMVKTIASMTVPGVRTFLTRRRAKLQGKSLTPEMVRKPSVVKHLANGVTKALYQHQFAHAKEQINPRPKHCNLSSNDLFALFGERVGRESTLPGCNKSSYNKEISVIGALVFYSIHSLRRGHRTSYNLETNQLLACLVLKPFRGNAANGDPDEVWGHFQSQTKMPAAVSAAPTKQLALDVIREYAC